ncbi:transcriptional regulator [Penicillium subrubescens]|uniref:transcriptional regulator n=1 Tax=Penicillium subrubescens TaxID=1316194 RepID=UPI002544E4FA|nr:transcriptional regulator [Penicillium subrubescens]KAJ5904850.1 transcriptional regulator [Penicillium subrubescens]
MYQRDLYTEPSLQLLFEFIRENPLGLITTAIPSSCYPLLQSSHIPWALNVHSHDVEAPVKGTLRGHMARQNPQSKAMLEEVTNAPNGKLQHDVMVMFTGADHHYVTPKFYTETKPQSAKVVPTWNYTAVQIYGKATIYHDSSLPETWSYLSNQLHDLSQHCETSIMGYTGNRESLPPWSVFDAPKSFIEGKKRSIIGIEITIETIQGKFKMSQDKGHGDRQGVIAGFRNLGSDIGTNMADMIKERGDAQDAKKRKKSLRLDCDRQVEK